MDLYFNLNGKTHYFRLRVVDHKDKDVDVWEALVDGREYVFFESQIDPNGEGPQVWELFELAIQSYLDYGKDETTVKTRWRD